MSGFFGGLQQYVSELSIYAMIVAAIALVSKSIFVAFIDRDLKRFEIKLKADFDKAHEKFKSDLNIERLKLQISYGGTFEKQAEAIVSLYKTMLEFKRAAAAVISEATVVKDETRDNLRALFFEIYDQYYSSRIYLPNDLDVKFSDFVEKTFEKAYVISRYDSHRVGRMSETQFKEMSMKIEDASKYIVEVAPKLEEDLIEDFRELLGVQFIR